MSFTNHTIKKPSGKIFRWHHLYWMEFFSVMIFSKLQFGDHDGRGSDVLLQHPLGVLYAKSGQVYIADSYNHKVGMLEVETPKIQVLQLYFCC